ncbi:MAG: polyprenol monophosphomannose synthase [Maribacter dokdonensis]|uniref:Dolichol-phosphate mannosyltransferase n=1 Tax=Maribacter dokdonensis TaxID=320912 RepID=A0A1H4K6N9_9FLAO|nr:MULTISPECIES: polyprenol monophosphomannose synthase [Maribacter]HAF76605.1 polyprenol monophosphomannose synthase [Maribacter sp.]APA63952.1 dolichyl-phosphate beta-D-mannosyltransferase [Maribacter sp. 1_2014MBL_MicDiv]KSA13224.1 Dolichol-phosphate mannosyltransferase [Maribacter dokdonensis DSW-8]MBU2900966.1 polyprenol monophosphomannose synthase [Maribacter dokdonensis]SEB54184.1 dolichol-phosphate mannosyltransferase [Maribacter dokdonensis]|tara:strand:- start:439 stop:1167 length:729 start_codon:yes stop_codon:yes gene_type:complete
MSSSIVIIPTYNEIENVEAIIRAVFVLQKEFHVLIVDDNSPDKTGDCVRGLQEEFKGRLFLETRLEKSGLGTAYIHGFKWAIAKGYDYIFEMDADFSHTPSDLLRLLKACENGADLAVGSRYKKGVNVVNWPLYRVLLSYGASIYVKLVTGMRVDDPTAGFVCYRREVLEAINLDSVRFVGYAFQIEMKFRAYLKHFKIEEVSIIFRDRVLGKSKMSSSIISEAIWGVFIMKMRSLFLKNKF